MGTIGFILANILALLFSPSIIASRECGVVFFSFSVQPVRTPSAARLSAFQYVPPCVLP